LDIIASFIVVLKSEMLENDSGTRIINGPITGLF